METYYTPENFIVYVLALISLLILVPLAVIMGESRKSVLYNHGMGCFIAAVSFYPLGRTCPYEPLSGYFSAGSLLFFSLGTAAFFMGLLFSMINGKRGFSPPTQWKIDLWIAKTLNGHYLVIDKKGSILGGNLVGIPGIIQPANPFFKTYLNSLLSHTHNSIHSESLLESFEKGVYGEGTLELQEKCFLWFYTPLGEKRTEGYLFTLLDVTEENLLLEERRNQERLQELRLKRIREQGLLKAQEERSRMNSMAIKQSTDMIRVSLEKLRRSLYQFKNSEDSPGKPVLLQAVKLGESTLASIRNTVHAMGKAEKEEL